MKNLNASKEEIGNQLSESISSIIVSTFFPGVSNILNPLQAFSKEIKVNRLLELAQNLEKSYLDLTGVELNINEFTTENIFDFFELVVFRVCSTKSIYKRQDFSKILLNQLTDPIDDQLINMFADILNSINELQLIILKELSVSAFSTKVSFDLILGLFNRTELPKNFDSNNIEVLYNNNRVFTNYSEIEFYVNDLISKGLIEKTVEQEGEIPKIPSSNSNNYSDKIKVKVKTEEKFKISKIGIEFLKIITED